MRLFLERILLVPEAERGAAYRSAIAAARRVADAAALEQGDRDPVFLAIARGIKKRRPAPAPRDGDDDDGGKGRRRSKRGRPTRVEASVTPPTSPPSATWP